MSNETRRLSAASPRRRARRDVDMEYRRTAPNSGTVDRGKALRLLLRDEVLQVCERTGTVLIAKRPLGEFAVWAMHGSRLLFFAMVDAGPRGTAAPALFIAEALAAKLAEEVSP